MSLRHRYVLRPCLHMFQHHPCHLCHATCHALMPFRTVDDAIQHPARGGGRADPPPQNAAGREDAPAQSAARAYRQADGALGLARRCCTALTDVCLTQESINEATNILANLKVKNDELEQTRIPQVNSSGGLGTCLPLTDAHRRRRKPPSPPLSKTSKP